MKKKLLTVTSIILVACLLFTAFPVSAVNVNDTENNGASVSNDMNISSTNSLGAMISDELGEEQEKQEENNGINIFSVEVDGNVATAEIETVLDATLIVGIYSEDGVEMYASGKAVISEEDEIVEVTIDIEAMPQYFYLKAYIVDSESLKPLCTVYESPNYTQEMQEFFAKTVEDFDEEKVLNLDGDDTNNFAVYNDEVKLIESTPDSANELVSSDDEQKVYVIENADESITSLQEGEIFSFAYDEENVIIVKVKTVTVEGTTATVTGDEINLEDAFDYIRIEGLGDLSDAEIDESLMDDDVEYCGMDNEKEENNRKKAEPVGASAEATFNHSFSVNIKGDILSSSLTFGIGVKVNVYLTRMYKFVQFSADYSIKLEATIKASGTMIKKKLPGVTVPLLGGLVGVALEPSFVVKPSVSISISGTLTGTIGVRYSSDKGFENCSKSPSFKTEIKIKGTLFIGVAMEPKVKVMYGVVEIGVETQFGVEIEASTTPYSCNDYSAYPSQKHSCAFCLDITITPKMSLSGEVVFLKILTFKKTFLEFKLPLMRFYFSADNLKFGKGTCPYIQYLITAIVKDTNGQPLSGAKLNLSDSFSYSTDSCGTAKFYLSPGEYTITAEKEQSLATRNLRIDSIPRTLEFVLNTHDSGSGSSHGGSGTDIGGHGGSGTSFGEQSSFDFTDTGNIAAVEANANQTAVLTKDGTVFLWGSNGNNKLAYTGGSYVLTPHKLNGAVSGIPENSVKQIALGANHSAVVLNDGSLYTWGYNKYGELGDGTKTDRDCPVKIMDNVMSVSLGDYHSAAITKDGSLYTWGEGYSGQLGNGSYCSTQGGEWSHYSVTSPVKIMENVKSVSLGSYHGAAITNGGDLYTWGETSNGQLGRDTSSKAKPRKVMGNISFVSARNNSNIAISTDGVLYGWGANSSGQLGDGTTTERSKPVKIANNIQFASCGGYHSVAVTKDGALYTWGYNNYGQLGNGETTRYTTPQHIRNDVASAAAGSDHTIIVTKGGRVHTCGYNQSGQLGNGSTSKEATLSFEEIPIYDYTPTLIARSAKKAIESVGANANKTTRFSGLKPGAIYNFYSVKTKSTEDIICNDNLLYIAQLEADENGNIEVTYNPREEYITPYEFVASMTHMDISKASVTDSPVTYNGLVQRYSPSIKFGNYTLYENIDYELNGIYSAVNAGEYVVEVTGKGDFVGSITKTFTINQANVSDTEVVGLENQEYTGEPITPNFIVKIGNRTLTKDTDYTVKYQNATDLGLGIVEIKGIGNYTGRKVCWFEISEGDISAYGTCVAIKYQAYTGEDVTPEPTVTMNGNILVKDQDYTVEYKNNSSVGTATLIVRGIGNYTGTLTTTFEIIDMQIGDTNLDGIISISDATAIQSHLAELEEFTDEQLALADTNGDGDIDIADATWLQMYIAEFDGIVLGKQAA